MKTVMRSIPLSRQISDPEIVLCIFTCTASVTFYTSVSYVLSFMLIHNLIPFSLVSLRFDTFSWIFPEIALCVLFSF